MDDTVNEHSKLGLVEAWQLLAGAAYVILIPGLNRRGGHIPVLGCVNPYQWSSETFAPRHLPDLVTGGRKVFDS